MRNVAAQSGCGNVDPLGILSTPVIDTTSHTIYVVATIQDSLPAHPSPTLRARHAHGRAEGVGQRRSGWAAELAQHPAARRSRARQRSRLHRLRRLRGRLRSVSRLVGVTRRERARQGRVQRDADGGARRDLGDRRGHDRCARQRVRVDGQPRSRQQRQLRRERPEVRQFCGNAPHRARSRRSRAATTTCRRSRPRSCRTTWCSRSASSRPASSSTAPT